MGSSDQWRTGRSGGDSVVAELAALNTVLAKYLVRALDADDDQAPPPSVEEELELAERFSAAAQALCDRVRHRELTKEDGACGADPRTEKDKQ